jgi:sec-independent protein translocase protein TatB
MADSRKLTASALAHYDEAMNLGMPEMIFIFLLALVIVGPKKLPELGRQLGKFLAEFKRASNEFKNQLETEMLNIELEERAKKQEDGSMVLPPAQNQSVSGDPWERIMRPITESVSRGKQELVSIMGSDPEPPKPAIAPVEPPSSPAKPVGGE